MSPYEKLVVLGVIFFGVCIIVAFGTMVLVDLINKFGRK